MLHVRVTEEMKSRIEQAARASGRSTNAEIVQRLEASFPRTALLAEAFERDMADAQPKDREERGLLLVYRGLNDIEREAIQGVLEAFTKSHLDRNN